MKKRLAAISLVVILVFSLSMVNVFANSNYQVYSWPSSPGTQYKLELDVWHSPYLYLNSDNHVMTSSWAFRNSTSGTTRDSSGSTYFNCSEIQNTCTLGIFGVDITGVSCSVSASGVSVGTNITKSGTTVSWKWTNTSSYMSDLDIYYTFIHASTAELTEVQAVSGGYGVYSGVKSPIGSTSTRVSY